MSDFCSLNLTAANRVYLLEPQWNPAIEAQAIGRALRLGQKRTVTIIRYVMEKTIEEVPVMFTKMMSTKSDNDGSLSNPARS